MSSPAHPLAHRLPRRGFTLIEILVAVAILALLAAIALPSFEASIRKGRRSDAMTSLAAVQQAQERWRGVNAAYTATMADTAVAPALPNGLGVSTTTASGYYTITVTNVNQTNYDAVATAVAGKSQANDGECKMIGAQMRGGNVIFGSGAAGINFASATPDVGKCWAR